MPLELSIEGKVFQFKREIREGYFELRLNEVIRELDINSDLDEDEIEKTTFKWLKNQLHVLFKDFSKDERIYAFKLINFEILQWITLLEDKFETVSTLWINEQEEWEEREKEEKQYCLEVGLTRYDGRAKPVFKWDSLHAELDKLLDELEGLKVHMQGSKGRPPSEIVHFQDCLRLDNDDFLKLRYVIREYFEGKYWVGFNKRKSGFGSLLKVLMEKDYTKEKEGTIKYFPIAKAFCNSFLPSDEQEEYIERFRKEPNQTKEDELETLRKLIPHSDEIHRIKLPK